MRYLPSLLRVQILSNDGICLGANINKFDQMWYLLHICIDFAVVVNPFFRAVPAVDTGGIRCEFFNDATKAIATFPAFKLLEGSDHRKLPAYNSTSVHSGLMEVLGRLIGHGILQSFIGFPCFAPPVYWYIATGDVHKALCYVTVDDVRDEEAREFIEKVLLQKPACKILN